MRIRKTAVAAVGGLSLLAACGQRSEAEQAPNGPQDIEAASRDAAEDAVRDVAGLPPRGQPEQVSGPPLTAEFARLLAGAQSNDYRLSTTLSPSLALADIPTGVLLTDAVAIAQRQGAFQMRASAQPIPIDGVPSPVNLLRSVFLSSPRESILIQAAGLPGQERVFGVHRYVGIPDAPVARGRFVADLEQRFGAYVERRSRYYSTWAWLSDGTPIPPSGIGQPGLSATNRGGTTYQWYLADCGGLPRVRISPRAYEIEGGSWPNRCGVQVAVTWDSGQDIELVTQYVVTLYDADTIEKVSREIGARFAADSAARTERARQAAADRRPSF